MSRGKKVSGKGYKNALKVWNKFEMKTIKDYHDLYLKCDVLLLADIFEKFRKNSSKNYGLCPSHYLSTRALSWDAMLNIKKVKLELISDLCMYILFEKGMRGGVSYVSNRYSKASNKYLKTYDPKQEFKHLIYLNTNNLYCYLITYFFQQVDSNGYILDSFTQTNILVIVQKYFPRSWLWIS